jgi:hypothetical protein
MKSCIILLATTTVLLTPVTAFAEQKKAAGKSQAECHRAALVVYPNPRTKEHQDAMARCMAGKKI